MQNKDQEKGVVNYWKKVLMGSYSGSLKQHDLDLLEYLQ